MNTSTAQFAWPIAPMRENLRLAVVLDAVKNCRCNRSGSRFRSGRARQPANLCRSPTFPAAS
jgi:hypothetical protein